MLGVFIRFLGVSYNSYNGVYAVESLLFLDFSVHTYNPGNDNRVDLPAAGKKAPHGRALASPRLPSGFRPSDD